MKDFVEWNLKLIKKVIVAFFCEFKSKCNGICTTVEFHRSEDEIRNCSNLIVEKKEVKENLKFKTGQLVMTCGVEALLRENELDFLNIVPLIFRHMNNDSELCEEDLEFNRFGSFLWQSPAWHASDPAVSKSRGTLR